MIEGLSVEELHGVRAFLAESAVQCTSMKEWNKIKAHVITMNKAIAVLAKDNE